MPVKFKLPQVLRQEAFNWHHILEWFANEHFKRMPQLLLLPSGRRLKWTKKGESEQYDFPNIFVMDMERKEKQIMRDIQCHVVELNYEEAVKRFNSALQGKAY